jgi:hypothetical protein
MKNVINRKDKYFDWNRTYRRVKAKLIAMLLGPRLVFY